MPKNTVKNQSRYQSFCRQQVFSGLINKPDGTWSSGSGAMARDMAAGYKIGGAKKRKRSEEEDVE